VAVHRSIKETRGRGEWVVVHCGYFSDKGEGGFGKCGHFTDKGQSSFGDFVRTIFMDAPNFIHLLNIYRHVG